LESFTAPDQPFNPHGFKDEVHVRSPAVTWHTSAHHAITRDEQHVRKTREPAMLGSVDRHLDETQAAPQDATEMPLGYPERLNVPSSAAPFGEALRGAEVIEPSAYVLPGTSKLQSLAAPAGPLGSHAAVPELPPAFEVRWPTSFAEPAPLADRHQRARSQPIEVDFSSEIPPRSADPRSADLWPQLLSERGDGDRSDHHWAEALLARERILQLNAEQQALVWNESSS
jgi:hypothetical protein